MDVTVAVATYGDRKWIQVAQRAIRSATDEHVPVVHIHADTLHDARNQALDRISTRWVIFLDADDELEPGYITAMATGNADLRGPAVAYVRRGLRRTPYVPRVPGHDHECDGGCITSGAGNWLVVGTCARTQVLRDVGGWRDWPMYEDYDLWMRALIAGATVEAIPAAVYRAHVRQDSRNRAPSMTAKNRVHHEINDSNLAPA